MYDVGTDSLLSNQYLYGSSYTRYVQYPNDSSVQPYNISIFWIQTEEPNNICTEVNATENGKIQFECEERHIIYGIMTLAFIMIPGHGIAQAFISRTPSLISLYIYQEMTILVIIIFGLIYGIIYANDPNSVQNLSTGTGYACASVTFLMVVFFSDLNSLPLAKRFGTNRKDNEFHLKRFLCGCEIKRFFETKRPILYIGHVLIYPFFLILSPILTTIVKLRAIFPGNKFFEIQKVLVAKTESLREAVPQALLQIFIIFQNLDREITLLQYAAVTSSLMAICLPIIEHYLQQNKKPTSLKYILGYYPLFFTASIFKILSVSLMFQFFTLTWAIAYGVIFGIILYAIITTRIYESKFEKLDQGWIHYTAIGTGAKGFITFPHIENSSQIHLFHRKCSFIYSLVIYTLTLVGIMESSVQSTIFRT